MLGIVVVGCPKKCDRRDIMQAGMKLWYIKVFTDAEIDKYLLVVVECV